MITQPGGTRRKRSNLLTNNLLTNNLHTYIPTYRPTYIHTYIPTILPSRSFTISFVFLCFPVPAKTIEAHFREKLTCGVIRSFIFCSFCLFTFTDYVPFCVVLAPSILSDLSRPALQSRWAGARRPPSHFPYRRKEGLRRPGLYDILCESSCRYCRYSCVFRL